MARARTAGSRASPRSRRLPFEMKSAIELHQLTLEVENRAQGTRYFYRLVLGRFCDYVAREGHPADAARLDLADLTLEHARAFLVWLKTQPSTNRLTGSATSRGPSSILQHIRALKGFSAFCVREGLLSSDPLKGLRASKVPERTIETFNAEQISRLLLVVERHPLRDRNLTLVYFLLATGVRVSELCGLKRSDVDLRERRAKVLGKGSKERYVYFDAQTGKLLLRYLAERREEVSWLFPSRSGGQLSRYALVGLFKDFGQEAGISDQVRCTPHTFRHTFAVQFLECHPGALFHLQELLGHTDLTMVKRYAKIAKGREMPEGPSVIESLGLDKRARRK